MSIVSSLLFGTGVEHHRMARRTRDSQRRSFNFGRDYDVAIVSASEHSENSDLVSDERANVAAVRIFWVDWPTAPPLG